MAEEKFSGWKFVLSWVGLFCLGWVLAGVIARLLSYLFILGWRLI